MLPKMRKGSGIGKTVQVDFGGYDRRPEARDGSFRETVGMSQRELPVMKTGDGRWRFDEDGQILTECLCSLGNELLRVADGNVYVNDIWIGNMELQISERLVSFGRKAIFPRSREVIDLTYIPKGTKSGASALPATAPEGEAWLVYVPVSDVPSDPPELHLFVRHNGAWEDRGKMIRSLEASVTPSAVMFSNGLYQGEEAEMNSIFIENGELNVDAGMDFTKLFKPGDALTISGCTRQTKNNQTVIVREVLPDTLRFYENTFRKRDWIVCYTDSALPDMTEMALVPTGEGTEEWPKFGFQEQIPAGSAIILYKEQLESSWYARAYDPETWELIDSVDVWELEPGWDEGLPKTELKFQRMDADALDLVMESFVYESSGTVTISRKWPEGLSGVFADSNRLWGWADHTLRASKLGDPSNWEFFDGTAEDSWAVDIQHQGPITGGISAHGYPTFFMENRRIRIYGGSPEAFQSSELDCNGVREGCGKSLAIVDGALYYISREGVMRDDGSVPVIVSQALGTLRLGAAVCGGLGTLLLTGGRDQAGGWHLFSFDTRNGGWIREGSLRIEDIAAAAGRLYACVWREDQNDGRMDLLCFGGWPEWGDWEEDGDGSFLLETNDYSMNQPNTKRVHRVQLRLAPEANTRITVSIQYDEDGNWINIARLLGDGTRRSVYLPILPRRCDRFRLRFAGTGGWRLESLALELRSGTPELAPGPRFTV